MDIMLQKSDSFCSSANLLGENLSSPSVHLAYYSVFILIKYVACHFLCISYEDQDDNKGQLSHKVIIDKVMDDIEVRDSNVWLDIIRRINSMKHLRAKADYKDETISSNALTTHLTYAKEILNYVKSLYGI